MLLRSPPSLPSQEALWQPHSHHQRLSLQPLRVAGHIPWASLTPAHPTGTARPGLLAASIPGFPWQSQISPSRKQFIHSTVTQKSFSWCLSGQQRNLWAFIPSQSKHAKVSPGSLSVCSPDWCHRSPCPLSCRGWAVHSLWLGHQELDLQLSLQLPPSHLHRMYPSTSMPSV